MGSLRILVSVFFVVFAINDVKGEKVKSPQDAESQILPPCQACKMVVESIQKGMARTNKKHFGGGDTAWEEEKLGDYRQSEVRLVEVQENLCSEVKKGQNQCYSLAEEWEQFIEEWWFKQKELGDLHDYLCVKKAEYCCPEQHYGPECKPCPGFPDAICSNNGKCKGSGTRKGNGECTCNEGYSGLLCDTCAETYYESYRSEKALLCSKCHRACKGPCSKAGPNGCIECNVGWIKDEKDGCLDLNECASNNPCRGNQFCVNNDGSYSCLDCDRSCDGCDGDGPDMCKKCADGYILKNNLCVDSQSNPMEWTRYVTYLGLCVATCIVFQKNTLVASIIGLSVAVYVSVSEYMLNNNHDSSFFSNAFDFVTKA